ncbi:sulfatase-like hydrolase/transferase [Thalassotalea fonticola]|uniref:Sulfatase-like hydrolase/transferase n=1 Tax=Thalassotalea fonticola TaxID=3065649 RepID=A0ABZ0GL88_9GAMM|nr:sulfatase-like hydrolase/transferase [Colwelliaceae bacterium S1-1]
MKPSTLLTFTFAFLVFTPWQVLAYTSSAQPNILVIISDDAGYSDFSFSGEANFNTPNIDSISQKGVHFPQGYVSASVCSPSRAGLMTGRNQQRFGYFDNLPRKVPEIYSPEYAGLPASEITLAEALQQQGYQTAAIGKWHLGYGEKFHPNVQGFDYFYGIESGSRSYWPNKKGLGPAQENMTTVKDEGYFTDTLTDKAINYLNKQGEQPFFMYLSYTAPHTPLHAKPEHLAMFADIQDKKRRALAAMTYSLDQNIGRVLKNLNDKGIDKNTLIFFLNDNGGTESNSAGNRPLTGYKGTVLEGGLRVPYAVSWPAQIKAGQVVNMPASSLDIFATAVAAAGGELAKDREYDGINLLPVMTGKSAAVERTLFWKRHGYAAVRQGDFKLIRLSDRPALLFNVNEDAGEHINLAEKHPDKVKAMLKALWQWERKHQHAKWQTKKNFNNEYIEKLDRAFKQVSQ